MVDADDFERLSKLKWYAIETGRGLFYAGRTSSRKNIKRFPILMHRFIWEMHHGPILKKSQIDHINGNRLDNRLVNLRICTASQNHANIHRISEHSSKFKGVGWSKKHKKWQAQTKKDREHVHLGYFDSEIEAARAYDARVRENFGGFAKLNLEE